jgi:hypothetical protein
MVLIVIDPNRNDKNANIQIAFPFKDYYHASKLLQSLLLFMKTQY